MENYETNEDFITQDDLIEEINKANLSLINGIKGDNKQDVLKYKIMLDNLINIYLKK